MRHDSIAHPSKTKASPQSNCRKLGSRQSRNARTRSPFSLPLTESYLFSVIRPERYLCMTLDRRVW